MATMGQTAPVDAAQLSSAGGLQQHKGNFKSRELQSSTIRAPRFAYAYLVMVTDSSSPSAKLDALQVRSYCTAALKQFLGDTGVAISIDILKVEGSEAWVRVPQPDLNAFSAALTAFPGISKDEEAWILQVRACGDWLGSLLGRSQQQQLWGS